MNKKISTPVGVLIIVLVAVILGGGILAYQYLWLLREEAKNAQEPVVCALEAKVCPDGSAVGRTGPNCEFVECSPAKIDETVSWETYTNTQYRFEIKYPNNWFVHDATNEVNCEEKLAGVQPNKILFSDKKIEDCPQTLTHGWFWFSIWIYDKYYNGNIDKNFVLNGIPSNKTIETEVNEIGDDPRTTINFYYNNLRWAISYLNDSGGISADSNFEKMLSTFKFIDVTPAQVVSDFYNCYIEKRLNQFLPADEVLNDCVGLEESYKKLVLGPGSNDLIIGASDYPDGTYIKIGETETKDNTATVIVSLLDQGSFWKNHKLKVFLILINKEWKINKIELIP
ncbi:MAG: hypothetical protein WC514_00960 [Candidatus Paceibacterota bacterium]